MRGERFAEGSEVRFVNDGRAGVDPFRKWVRRSGAPVFEFVDGVVMQVVNEFEAVVAHFVGFLRDGGVDYAALNPIERAGILIESDHRNFSLEVKAMERFSDAGAARGFKANDAVETGLALNER